MIRKLPLVAVIGTLFVALLPMRGNAQADATTYALRGESRALEIAFGGQGLTAGVAVSEADSKPSARGGGAGACEVLGEDPDPGSLPCTDATAETSSLPGEGGDDDETCAVPPVPDPLSTVLDIDIACGFSKSGEQNGLPFTTNSGEVGEISLQLDVAGIVPQLEDAKEQVVDALQGVLDQAPEPIETALDQILDSIDQGEGGHIRLGPATSNITSDDDLLQCRSTSAGAQIGLVGIPDLDQDGVPIPGSSNAIEDGLIIIEVGSADASATVDTAKGEIGDVGASAAVVVIKVRDITQATPTYVEIPVAPGQTQTILEGTPLESTITAAVASTEKTETTGLAAADSLRLELLKGVQGGLLLGLARSTCAATVEAAPTTPEPTNPPKSPEPPQERPPLPQTGARDLAVPGLVLLVGAVLVLLGVRRLAK